MQISVLEYLEQTARAMPEKTAFADESGALTFARLREAARAVGSALEDFAVWLAYSWVWLAVIAAVAVIVIRIVRRRGGGMKKLLTKVKAQKQDTEAKE